MKRKRRAVEVIFVICIGSHLYSIHMWSPGHCYFSLKFNLKGKKEELTSAIRELERIKKKVDYVISCNGDFTENEFKQIIDNV